jgi:hypothetical protein
MCDARMSDPALRTISVDPAPAATSLANPPFTAGKAIGQAFRVMARNVVTFGLVSLAFFAVAIVVEMAIQGHPERSGAWRFSTVAVTAVGGVAMSLALALEAVAAAVSYHGLRAEKEGLPLQRLGAVFE